jgi:hypothetical protein
MDVPVFNRTPIGIYLHHGPNGTAADAQVCIVETTPRGTLIVRDADNEAAMRIVLSHLTYGELECLMAALYAHRRIA